MRLEAREILTTTAELKRIENALKRPLNIPPSDERRFHALLDAYKEANPNDEQQSIISGDLEHEYNERQKLIAELNAIIDGTKDTRDDVQQILSGLTSQHQFAKFLSDLQIKLSLGADTRTLQYANHAAFVFDELSEDIPRNEFPNTVLKEMIASTENPSRNKSSEAEGGMPIESIMLELTDDEIETVLTGYATYLQKKDSIWERITPRKKTISEDYALANIFTTYPQLKERIDGIEDSITRQRIKETIGNIAIEEITNKRKKEIAEALQTSLTDENQTDENRTDENRTDESVNN